MLKKKNYITLLFFAIIIIVPLVLLGMVNWYQRASKLPYYGVNNIEQKSAPYYAVPDFQFTNQSGQTVGESFVKNKIWVANYFFTSCSSTCPIMMSNLLKVQSAFAKDSSVRLISFTVDPERDSAARLNKYAHNHFINTAQWQLATGAKKDLYEFARKGLFIVASDGDGGPDDFIHSSYLVLVDKDNHIRGYYDGTQAGEIKTLIDDIKKLQ
jgi:protein SCO1/2